MQAKACHVTSDAECHRRFGSEASTRMVQGVVRAVERRATKTGRNQNYVTAVYTVGEGFHREATLNLRSVLATCDVAPSPAADGEGLRPPPPPMMSQQAYETPPRRVQTTEAAGTQTAETNTATATNETNETNTATNTATNETNTTTTNGRQPTVVCHDREWFDDPAACLSGVGQSSVARKWLIRDGVGDSDGGIASWCWFHWSRKDCNQAIPNGLVAVLRARGTR